MRVILLRLLKRFGFAAVFAKKELDDLIVCCSHGVIKLDVVKHCCKVGALCNSAVLPFVVCRLKRIIVSHWPSSVDGPV